MKCVIAVLIVLAIPLAAAHGDTIVNPDFDGVIGTPPAAPWVTSGTVQIWPFNNDPGANSQVARLGLGAGNPASLSQTFACGVTGPDKVCNVTVYIVWTPNVADPNGDEVFEILDGGAVVYSLTFADGFVPLAPLLLTFGECGSQTMTFRISDPTDNNIDSWAYVDSPSCSCDEPVPVERSTWGEIKSRYR